MDSGFLELYSGLQSPGFWTQRAKFSRIPESTSQNFLRFRNSDSLTWADPGEGSGGPAPLISVISRPNWGSKGRKKVFLRPAPLSQGLDDGPPPYLKVCIRRCNPWSTHIFQFSLSVKNRRYIRVLWMFKLFLAKKPHVNLHGNLKRQIGNGI